MKNGQRNLSQYESFAKKKNKIKEYQFKFIHRTVVTKRELFKYGIKTDDECCFCGEKKTPLITLLFTAPLRNNSYKKSFCGSTQRTIHSSLQQQRNFIRNYLQL